MNEVITRTVFRSPGDTGGAGRASAGAGGSGGAATVGASVGAGSGSSSEPLDPLTGLATLTSALIGVRTQIHALQALEASLLTTGSHIARLITDTDSRGDHGEFAHRAVAAELGLAVNESDRAMTYKINRAVTLVTEYPAVHDALAAGHISPAHANAIIEAGSVIGNAGVPSAARDQYAQQALAIAAGEVVGRVRPLVKELAEQYTNRPLNDRHRVANAGRMVMVRELDDGMAELTAVLSASYAFGIKDRLTQMAKRVKNTEAACARATKQARTERGGPGTAVTSTGSTGSTGSAASTASTAAGADATTASADTPESLEPVVVERSMDQIRADLFTDMLLAGDPNNIAGSATNGLQAITARVQVIVPKVRVTPSPERAPGPEAGPARTRPPRTTDTTGTAETVETADAASQAGHARTTGTAGTADSAGTAGNTGATGATGAASVPAPPATLAGYGPIDDDTAKRLAGNAPHWEEATIDAHTGDIITVDTYRPSAKLRRYLGARDLHCRFPGCRVPLARCEIDHTIDAALGGPTSTDNLAHLCRLCRRRHNLHYVDCWIMPTRPGLAL